MKLLHTFGDTRSEAEAAVHQIEHRGDTNIAKVAPIVDEILTAIRTGGDTALLDYATRLDGFHGDSIAALRVSAEEMRFAWDTITDDLKAAMLVAQANIRAFAERQLPKSWSTQQGSGIETGQVVRPLGSVGCYVPGGRYPLPSTLLMTTTPAGVAGVERIVVCSPRPALETLAAAHLAGVTEFYSLGGAQAVAALAFGTETIAPVDKIVGPGNAWVAAAKLAVSTLCGIDMPAGPTEIVVTSETGNPRGIAADLVAQAEHDPEALAILITTNLELAEAVRREADLQSAANPIAQQSLAAQGFVFVTKSVTEAQTLTNRLAPEHLSPSTKAPTSAGLPTPAPSLSASTPHSPSATTSPAPTTSFQQAATVGCAAVSLCSTSSRSSPSSATPARASPRSPRMPSASPRPKVSAPMPTASASSWRLSPPLP